MDHDAFRRWIDHYEQVWRSPGTSQLAKLFAEDAVYLHSPYAEPIQPLSAIEQDWDEQRKGADEVFSMEVEILAVAGDNPEGPRRRATVGSVRRTGAPRVPRHLAGLVRL